MTVKGKSGAATMRTVCSELDRSLKIQTILTELRVKVQRSQEIDQQLTQLSKELSKLIRHAQRSIDGAIEMKLDDLDRLGQKLQGEEGQEHAPETS